MEDTKEEQDYLFSPTIRFKTEFEGLSPQKECFMKLGDSLDRQRGKSDSEK